MKEFLCDYILKQFYGKEFSHCGTATYEKGDPFNIYYNGLEKRVHKFIDDY
jgi:hypothetical protein